MRAQRIETSLRHHYPEIEALNIVDESKNHAGRKGTESHFQVLIVTKAFVGKSRVQRQREVYQHLNPEFESGMHALSLRLLTPMEYEKINSDFKSPDCGGKGS